MKRIHMLVFMGSVLNSIVILSGMLAAVWAGNNSGAAFNQWPDSGQRNCYSDSSEISCPAEGEPFFGQDAQYRGLERSYTKLASGGNELPDSATFDDGWIMTKDNVTGLIWEVKTDDGSIHDKDNRYTWCDTNPDTNGGSQGVCGAGNDTQDFIDGLNSAGFGGYADWRLPTLKELSTLVDSSIVYPGPNIDTAYFPNTMSCNYWSSTTVTFGYNSAWRVYFYEGWISNSTKSYGYYVRAVRGGESDGQIRFIDSRNGTITDTATGLMWQKCSMGQQWDAETEGCDGSADRYTWESALEECETLNFAGYDDWRLPDRSELQAIVDYSIYGPSIIETYFPNTESYYYWSSTTDANRNYDAWRVSFNSGLVFNYNKSDSWYVRAVRGVPCGLLDYRIAGYARDFATDSPLSGAVISANTGRSTASDQDGAYRLGLEDPGLYDITVSKTGYQTITMENVQVQEDEDTILDIYLTVPGPLNIVSTSLPQGTTGVPYNSRVKITGGVYPYGFSVSQGYLPSGLNLDAGTGVISGTPAVCGSFPFTVELSDSAPVPDVTDRVFSMEVICGSSYTISGQIIRYGEPLSGADIMLTGSSVEKHFITGADGTYRFDQILDGTYYIIPVLDGHEFDPSMVMAIISGSDLNGQDFDAVTIGDVDQDADVDGVDLGSLSDMLASGGYDPALDFNHDDYVDEKDVEVFADGFGR